MRKLQVSVDSVALSRVQWRDVLSPPGGKTAARISTKTMRLGWLARAAFVFREQHPHEILNIGGCSSCSDACLGSVYFSGAGCRRVAGRSSGSSLSQLENLGASYGSRGSS